MGARRESVGGSDKKEPFGIRHRLEFKVGGEESAETTKMSHIHPPLLRGTTRKCKYEPSLDGTGTESESDRHTTAR